jgi:hypothetical protein
MAIIKFSSLDLVRKFSNYPDFIRDKLFYLRQLILDVALEHSEVGAIEETLKWGEPCYNNPKVGSAVRIAI